MHVVDAVGPLSRPSFWASALFPSCHVYWQLNTPGCPLLQGMGTEELTSLPRREAAFSQYLTDMAQKYPPLAFSQEKAVVPSTLQNPVGSDQGWTPAKGTPCSAPFSTFLFPPALQVSPESPPSTNHFIRIIILESTSREPDLRQFGSKIDACLLKWFHKILLFFFFLH